jgi:hypothetical protein
LPKRSPEKESILMCAIKQAQQQVALENCADTMQQQGAGQKRAENLPRQDAAKL